MWLPRQVEVAGVRRAVDVQIDWEADEAEDWGVNRPVVVLFGPTGSGKSSTEIALAWLLAGEARTLELGRLSKDEIRNDMMNAAVSMELVNEDGEVLEILRTLTMAGTHDLMVNGAKFKNLGDATDALEEALGCSTDQLGYLTSAQALVSRDGLEQAELLLGLMGPDMTWADLEDRCEGVPEPPLSADTDLTGYPLMEAALENAETQRTEQGREKRAAESAVETASETLMGLCREARVPGPGNIGAALTQAQKAQKRDTERLEKLQKQSAAAAVHAERVRLAEERLAAAEADVAALKQKRAEADEVREEREAERAEIIEKIEAAEVKLQTIEEDGSHARQKRNEAQAKLDAWPSPEKLAEADECPTCHQDLPPEVIEEIETEHGERKQHLEFAQKKLNELEDAYREQKATIAKLGEELPDPLPPADELERKFDAAKTEADEAFTKLEELRGKDVPAKPQPEAIQATQEALDKNRTKLEALTRAQAAKEAHDAAKKTADQEAKLYDRYNKLVDRLREIIREVAEEAIEPVLERSNDMLAGRLTLDYSADDGIQAVYSEEEKRPVRELSTGERLMVGVTLQASIAVTLGVGVCLVDDTSNWDLETQRMMHEEMAGVGREHGVVWVCASTHEPLDVTGVKVLEIEGGYSA